MALDAVRHVHRLVNSGHREVVDGDLSNYFGEIPHAELLQSLARRVSDGRMLGWIKLWLEMAVEEDDGKGGKRRTNRAAGKQGRAPLKAPRFRRCSVTSTCGGFILGWKRLGHARRYEAEIVNYADDFVVCGKAPAEAMSGRCRTDDGRAAIADQRDEDPAACECRRNRWEFLGYRIGRNYNPRTGRAYIGTRPSRDSVRSICRKISEATEARYGLMDAELVVERLNRAMLGWANYFQLGQVSPAYRALDRHATKRLRQWLCRKHKVKSGKYVRFPGTRLWTEFGLARLGPRTASFSWAEGMIATGSRMREIRRSGSTSGEKKRG